MVLGGLFLHNIKLTSMSLNRTIEENGFSKVKRDHRSVYVSTVFDVIDRSDPDDPDQGGKWGGRFEILPRHNAIFADMECKNMLWEFPLVLPPGGMLATRDFVVPRAEPLYLWQPEVQVTLAANVDPDAVRRDDWLGAVLSVYQDDMEYYKYGKMIPRKIQGSDRAQLLSSIRPVRLSSQLTANWDNSYLPSRILT